MFQLCAEQEGGKNESVVDVHGEEEPQSWPWPFGESLRKLSGGSQPALLSRTRAYRETKVFPRSSPSVLRKSVVLGKVHPCLDVEQRSHS